MYSHLLKGFIPFVILILVLAILARIGLDFLLKTFFRNRSINPTEFPYQRVDSLLTMAELSFYGVLCKAAGNDLQVFAKARLLDLVSVTNNIKNRQAYLNRVQSKHVDFVLCNLETISPVLVIELDDSSHEWNHRKERDLFLDDLCAQIGLPLLRIPVKRTYQISELSILIRKEIDQAGVKGSVNLGQD